MCGELMRLSERDVQERVPGSAQHTPRRVREWMCPECDYFEEAERDDEG